MKDPISWSDKPGLVDERQSTNSSTAGDKWSAGDKKLKRGEREEPLRFSSGDRLDRPVGDGREINS